MAGSIGWGWNVLHGWPLLEDLQDAAHATHLGWRMKCAACLMRTCKWQGLPTFIPIKFYLENHLKIYYYIGEPFTIAFHHQSNNIIDFYPCCHGFLSDCCIPNPCRVALLALATVAFHGTFIIEQPRSSLLILHDRMQNVLEQIQVGVVFGCVLKSILPPKHIPYN